jgi:hypothetical protein
MKPKLKSMEQPRGYSGAGNRSAMPGTPRAVAERHAQHHTRVSPWLPVALGAFAFLVVVKAIAKTDRHQSKRWGPYLEDRWNHWWPDVRDTAEGSASRAGRWLYDHTPSRSRLADMFDSDWLPNIRANKRHLMRNFDWNNPPRWLRDVDLSTSRKRRRFLNDLKRYGTRKSEQLAASLGLR